MSNASIRPTSLDGIKRLAKTIKREQGIQHAKALDVAAAQAGYENFRHAMRGLENAKPGKSRYKAFISVYWRDRAAGRDGRETLVVLLAKPLNELLTPAQLTNQRSLAWLRFEGPDHLARKTLVRSQSDARDAACQVARALQFMDATQLNPSRALSRALPRRSSLNSIPGLDHQSVWFDGASKRYLITDEPYEFTAELAEERKAWAKRHGYAVIKSAWGGMHYPGACQFFLIADSNKGIPLGPVVAALNQLPPIVEEPWAGISAPTIPVFFSPGRIAQIETLESKTPALRKPAAHGNTVQYNQTFVGPQRRPKGKMPVIAHTEVGKLIKSVLVVSNNRKGVYSRLNSVRSELDEWVMREYKDEELPAEQFFELYYHESGATYARYLPDVEKSRHLASIQKVRSLLTEHYPECSPLSRLLKKLDLATESMRTWGT